MAFKVSAVAPMSHDVPGDMLEARLTAELHRLNSQEGWQVETLSCFILWREGGEPGSVGSEPVPCLRLGTLSAESGWLCVSWRLACRHGKHMTSGA